MPFYGNNITGLPITLKISINKNRPCTTVRIKIEHFIQSIITWKIIPMGQQTQSCKNLQLLVSSPTFHFKIPRKSETGFKLLNRVKMSQYMVLKNPLAEVIYR